MNFDQLFSQLKEQKIKISVKNEKLQVITNGKMSPDLINSIKIHKQSLIDWCHAQNNRLTPSDFPYANLNQRELDELQKRYAEIENIYITTPMQEGLLFHALIDMKNSFYTMQVNFDFNGKLNVSAFKQAWRLMIKRHAVFRTSFVGFENEQIHQLVSRQVEFPFFESDLRHVPANERQSKLDAFQIEDRSKVFDFDKAPLLRINLIRLEDKKYHLSLSYHHVLLDGWCIPIIFSELMHIYNSINENKAPVLNDAQPYENYIAWLYKKTKAKGLSFWKDYLAGYSQPTRLPACPYNNHKNQGIGEVTLDLAENHSQNLQQLSKQQHCTISNILQVAWACVLRKYTGQDEIVFGTTISGRPAELVGVDQIIGVFINTIPLRVSFSESLSLQKMLSHLNVEGLDREEYGFLSLAEIQNVSELSGQTPLFDNLLVFENYPKGESLNDQQESELAIGNTKFVEQNSYPFTLLTHLEGLLSITANYQTQLFSKQTVTFLLKDFETVLIALTQHLAERNINDLGVNWYSAAKKPTSTIDKNHPANICIHQLFEQQVIKHPQQIAVSDKRQSLSYLELNKKANRLAHLLADMGIEAGERLGVFLPNSVEMLIAVLATMKVSAVYVPLEVSQPANRTAQLIKDAEVEVILLKTEQIKQLQLLELDFVSIDEINDDNWLQEYPDNNLNIDISSDAQLYILYTSGSTGQPKGVQITHANVFNYLKHCQDNYLSDELTGAVVSTPLCFDATVTSLYLPLISGKQLILLDTNIQLIERLSNYLFNDNGTWLFKLTPAHLQAVAEYNKQDNSSKRRHVLVLGGEALAMQTLQGWKQNYLRQATFINEYGPTEATVGCVVEIIKTQKQLQELSVYSNVSIGKSIDGCEVFVLDEQGNEQLVNVAGELYIGGAGLSSGYLNRRELNEQAFIEVTWENYQGILYRTGDSVRRLPDGRLDYLGRNDGQIKLRGYRIELGEIEACIQNHEGVSSVAVLVHEQTKETAHIVAYCTLAENSAIAASQMDKVLKSWLQTILPEYMLPTSIKIIEKMPLTINGKLDKEKLIKLTNTGQIRSSKAEIKTNSTAENQSFTSLRKIEAHISSIWQEVLKHQDFGLHDSFFDMGGNSILAIRVFKKLDGIFTQLNLTDLFDYPSINALASYLASDYGASSECTDEQQVKVADIDNSGDMAIIGMSGRFPDAENIDVFWDNIKSAKESISHFSDQQLLDAGISAELLSDPEYVKSGVLLDNIELFDADYFGFSAREAQITDPQQRILLECATEALESAGYGDAQSSRNVGVYLGVGLSNYLITHLLSNHELISTFGIKGLMLANDKDYAATRLSYKLNLTGPSINVNTACSTSLVALHLASQALKNNEAEMALVGGAGIGLLEAEGYIYEEGGIHSRDGHCRTFDASATGTRMGSGAGMVLIKPLRQALKDGDPVQAIIKGSALNNDGSNKIGYTAPSVEGQSRVITKALSNAGVAASSIDYIETHGTATQLGDPIEVRALAKAFKTDERKEACVLGALKANIGHLDAAAGVAGLMKIVLALKNKKLPASVNFSQLNPEINMRNTPFYINSVLKDWQKDTDRPRRAAISSFGIGGTNAHVVLQEADAKTNEESLQEKPVHMLNISAKSEAALIQMESQLLQHMQENPDILLADIAYTLNVGRTDFAHRRVLIIEENKKEINLIKNINAVNESCHLTIVFAFPGQGNQHLSMAGPLYDSEPVFKSALDDCAALIKNYTEEDIIELLYQDNKVNFEQRKDKLIQTAIAQPCIFAVEYALSKLWMSWGVMPEIMIGHSLGEYVAACVSGVFSLENALKLVCQRGQLMQKLASGSMLSIAAPADKINLFLEQHNCSLAAVNATNLCVASGQHDDIKNLSNLLENHDIESIPLHTSHAFHSSMMEPILNEFLQLFDDIDFGQMKLTFISNVSGKSASQEQVTSSQYWVNHMRQTVQFNNGISEVLSAEDKCMIIEMGPGVSLNRLIRQNTAFSDNLVVSSLRHPLGQKNDLHCLYQALGTVWMHGVDINWQQFHKHTHTKRVALPSYPFQRKRYWITKAGHIAKIELSERNNHNNLDVDIHKQTQMTNIVEADNDVQQQLVKIWHRVLGIDTIGIKNNFFELGGDSFMAIRLLNLIRKAFQSGDRDFSIKQFFENPTIEACAESIMAEQERMKIQANQAKLELNSNLITEGEI